MQGVAAAYSRGVHYFLLDMLVKEFCDRHNASKPDALDGLHSDAMLEELRNFCRANDTAHSNPNGTVERGIGFLVPDVVCEAFPGAFWRTFGVSEKLPTRSALTKVLKRPTDPEYEFTANDVDIFHKTWQHIMGPYYKKQAQQNVSGTESLPQWKIDLMKRKNVKSSGGT